MALPHIEEGTSPHEAVAQLEAVCSNGDSQPPEESAPVSSHHVEEILMPSTVKSIQAERNPLNTQPTPDEHQQKSLQVLPTVATSPPLESRNAPMETDPDRAVSVPQLLRSRPEMKDIATCGGT